MGAPTEEQIQIQLPPEVASFSNRRECPKYNWTKMDAYERIGVNVMEAVGSKNAVIGGSFGIVIFIVAVFFFRKQIGSILIDGIFKKRDK